jgi:hypothetical protein
MCDAAGGGGGSMFPLSPSEHDTTNSRRAADRVDLVVMEIMVVGL